MHASTSTPTSTQAPASPPAPSYRWRVVDIVVASVVGVASGLVFLLWNVAYRGPSALLEPLWPGLQGLLDGPWLFAGVLGALIIRKPGAAVFTEVVRPTRLAWTEPDVEGGMTTTITFVELDADRTEVTTHQTNVPQMYLTPEARAGFESSLDRCDAYLATLTRGA